MSEQKKKKVFFGVFLLLTIYLFYAHFEARSAYSKKLAGLEKLVQGQGIKEKITIDERYAVMTLQSKSGETKGTALVIPYTFVVDNKTFKGAIGALDKNFESVISDSVYYLPENPEINAVHPKEDHRRLEESGPWNWRLYLGMMTALVTIGSVMKDKDQKNG